MNIFTWCQQDKKQSNHLLECNTDNKKKCWDLTLLQVLRNGIIDCTYVLIRLHGTVY